MNPNYVCPQCRRDLIRKNHKFFCQICNLEYDIKKGIPNFLKKDLSNENSIILNSLNLIDLLSNFYESKIWYPIVYHMYGGINIPSIQETKNKIVKMVAGENNNILDVACGTGLYTRSLSKHAEKVYGIDISQGMLLKNKELAKKSQLSNIVLARANVERLPFSSNFFDAAICCGSLHLFPDTIKALKEIARVLKKDSYLAGMTFIRRRFLKYRFIWEHLKEKHGAHIFSIKELNYWLKKARLIEFNPEIYGSMILFSVKKK